MTNVILWSPITRLLHWCIALPVLVNFFLDGGDDAHKVLGYVALGTMLIRLGWGVVAKDQAHFKFFPIGPQEIKNYTLGLVSGKTKNYSGHNPLASVAYILIWVLVGLLGVSGFMMGLDYFWGEDWLEEVHDAFSNGLVVLVVLHLVGIGMDGLLKKRKTWKGMITGKRE